MATQQQVIETIGSFQRDLWIKTYLPLITTFVGLFFGFFLNTIKDSVVNRRNIVRYKKVIKEEVFLATQESLDLAKRICKALDEAKENGKAPYAYVSRVSDISFKEFYPKSIYSYSVSERKDLNVFYSNIDFINSHVNGNFSTMYDKDISGGVARMNHLMIAIFNVYRCHANLHLGKNRSTMTVGNFLDETEIESEFYRDLIKRASTESSSHCD